MSTLWSKGTQATELVDDFTVGNDRILDMRLARYDVLGSKAHIKMLESIGLLTAEELEILTDGLDGILEEIAKGDFVLEDDVEDIHSQVELLLTRRLGDIGKKIHSGIYFEQVVTYASKRFYDISNGRYNFKIANYENGGKGNSKKGLDLLVIDSFNGSERPTSTLSGGETFMASISLALALTDVVQNRNGGIQLDSSVLTKR